MTLEKVNNTYVVNDKGIYGFFKEHRFLSNFHIEDVLYDGIIYPTVEHAYQAAKSLDREERVRVSKLDTPGKAKKEGQKLDLREDWEEVKYQVMLNCTRNKYTDPVLKQMLLDTSDKYLEETNWWNDQYWGVCKGNGQNNLGKILMIVRGEIDDV